MQIALRRAAERLPKGALVLLLATGAALAIAISPANGLVVVTAVAAILSSIWGTLWPARWVFLLLVGKPLIDLTWRWRFFTIFRQDVNVQSIIGVFVIGFTALVVITRWRQLRVSRLYWLFIGSAAASVLLHPSSQGMNEIIRLYAGASFFITAGYVLRDKATFDRFVHAFLITVFIPVLLSFAQLATLLPYEYWDRIDEVVTGRVSGTYQHPLGLIYFLMYAVPLALYSLENNRRDLRAILLPATFIALSSIALVFTYHRTALITILLMYLLWLILQGHRRIAVAVIAGGIVMSIPVAGWATLIFQNLFDIISGNIELASPSFLRGRGTNWYLFLNSYLTGGPLVWAFGRGASVAEGIVPVFGLYLAWEPHNDFIRVLHAYGLVGLTLYLALMWTFLMNAIALRSSSDAFSRNIGTIMISALFAVFMLSITGEPLRYPTGVWYLFALGAIVSRQYRLSRPRAALDNGTAANHS